MMVSGTFLDVCRALSYDAWINSSEKANGNSFV
jgi:hypothetical protein